MPSFIGAEPNLAVATTSPSHALVAPEKKYGFSETEKREAGAVIGAVSGMVLFRNHPVLGLLNGVTIGSSIPSFLVKEERVDAACRVGITAAGTAMSLFTPKHPVLGYLAGSFLGIVATAYVPGSTTRDRVMALREAIGK